MSHFSLVVRVPASVAFAGVDDAVAALLAPYEEGTDDPKYRAFEDEEDDYRKKYETESSEMVEMPNGERVYPLDERFRVPGSFGIGGDSHRVPPDLKRIQWAHRDRFPTFEIFMKDYAGYNSRDAKTGRYGHWWNPNRKWDWYAIGGRWDGKFRVKPSAMAADMGGPSWTNEGRARGERETNVCRIRDLDWDTLATEARDRVAKFLSEWRAFLGGKKFEIFDGPRDAALSLGWLECKDRPELTGKEFWTQKWPRQNTPGVDRFDVVAVEPKEEEWQDRLLAHFNPIRPFAFMDADGWRERGRVGWFGASSETPDSVRKNDSDFFAWVRSGDSADWLVCVDCHI